MFPAIWNWKKLVPSYFEPENHSCTYLEREKSGSMLFGDLNIWKRKKLVPSYFEPEKHCRMYLLREKSGFLLFGDQTM